MDALNAQLFVDITVAHPALVSLVASIAGGRVEGYTVVGREAELDVLPNDQAGSGGGGASGREAFLYYPYVLDLEATGGTSTDRFVALISTVMSGLARSGAKVVAACDWEDQLPGAGRLED